jgi:hypothetical protein
VVQPPSELVPSSRQLAITDQPSGTRAVRWKVALSRGVSFTGYQKDAACGSPTTYAPPDADVCQPFLPVMPYAAAERDQLEVCFLFRDRC